MSRTPRLLMIDKTGGLPTSRERTSAVAEAAGYETHLLCPKRWLEHGMHFEAEPGDADGYRVHTAPVVFSGYYARSFYWRGLAKVLRKVRPDVIHLLEEPYALFSLQTQLLARRICSEAKILFYAWENIDRGFTYPARVQFLYRYADRLSHRRSAGAVCATPDAEKALLKKGFSGPTIVAPYGVESVFLGSRRGAEAQRRSATLGYVGRLLPMKGLDLLVRALAKLENVDLEIVGTGPEEENLKRLSRELRVEDRVRFLGAMPAEKVREILPTWACLVLPSRTTPLWMEQLGRVLIEAMALETPIIGSRTGSIPWVVGEAGLLFDEDDVVGLVDAVAELLQNPKETKRRVRLGAQRVRDEFTWPTFAQRVAGFYSRILNRHIEPEA